MGSLTMFGRLTLLSAGAMIVLAVAACAIQLRDEKAGSAAAPAAVPARPVLASGLERCRAVTLDQTGAYEDCRRLWAENRRRFFGKNGSTGNPSGSDRQNATLEVPPKDQSRLPQGLPPKGSKEGE